MKMCSARCDESLFVRDQINDRHVPRSMTDRSHVDVLPCEVCQRYRQRIVYYRQQRNEYVNSIGVDGDVLPMDNRSIQRYWYRCDCNERILLNTRARDTKKLSGYCSTPLVLIEQRTWSSNVHLLNKGVKYHTGRQTIRGNDRIYLCHCECALSLLLNCLRDEYRIQHRCRYVVIGRRRRARLHANRLTTNESIDTGHTSTCISLSCVCVCVHSSIVLGSFSGSIGIHWKFCIQQALSQRIAPMIKAVVYMHFLICYFGRCSAWISIGLLWVVTRTWTPSMIELFTLLLVYSTISLPLVLGQRTKSWRYARRRWRRRRQVSSTRNENERRARPIHPHLILSTNNVRHCF
jgi:hypothetical protein